MDFVFSLTAAMEEFITMRLIGLGNASWDPIPNEDLIGCLQHSHIEGALCVD